MMIKHGTFETKVSWEMVIVAFKFSQNASFRCLCLSLKNQNISCWMIKLRHTKAIFFFDRFYCLPYLYENKQGINRRSQGQILSNRIYQNRYKYSLPTFFQFSDIDVSKSTISDSPSESFPSSPGSSFKYFPSCDEEGMDSVSIVIISRLPSCNSFTAFTCSNNFVTESRDAEAKIKN